MGKLKKAKCYIIYIIGHLMPWRSLRSLNKTKGGLQTQTPHITALGHYIQRHSGLCKTNSLPAQLVLEVPEALVDHVSKYTNRLISPRQTFLKHSVIHNKCFTDPYPFCPLFSWFTFRTLKQNVTKQKDVINKIISESKLCNTIFAKQISVEAER